MERCSCCMRDAGATGGRIFMRASLRCVPASQTPGFHPNTRKPRVLGTPASREQLRAGLRRKESRSFDVFPVLTPSARKRASALLG
ncbi:MAG: hypothetical protein ACJ71W_00965 [Terriglobales bacterium]